MRRILIALVAVIITSASIFWACSKDGENEEVTKVNNEKCIKYFEIDPGILHNELLKNDMLTPGYSTRTNIENLKIDYDYLTSNGICDPIGFEEFLSDIDTSDFDIDVSLLEIALKLADKNGFNETFRFYAQKLNELENIQNGVVLLFKLKDLQNSVENDNNLSFDEKYCLLGAISIATNSYIFWAIEYPNYTEYPFGKPKSVSQDEDNNCCDDIKVAWADTKGWFHGLFQSGQEKPLHSAGTTAKRWSKVKAEQIRIENEQQNINNEE